MHKATNLNFSSPVTVGYIEKLQQKRHIELILEWRYFLLNHVVGKKKGFIVVYIYLIPGFYRTLCDHRSPITNTTTIMNNRTKHVLLTKTRQTSEKQTYLMWFSHNAFPYP